MCGKLRTASLRNVSPEHHFGPLNAYVALIMIAANKDWYLAYLGLADPAITTAIHEVVDTLCLKLQKTKQIEEKRKLLVCHVFALRMRSAEVLKF